MNSSGGGDSDANSNIYSLYLQLARPKRARTVSPSTGDEEKTKLDKGGGLLLQVGAGHLTDFLNAAVLILGDGVPFSPELFYATHQRVRRASHQDAFFASRVDMLSLIATGGRVG